MWDESKLLELARNSAGMNEAHEALFGIGLLLQFLISRPDPELAAALETARDLICDRLGIE
jgi:hypothetical protein